MESLQESFADDWTDEDAELLGHLQGRQVVGVYPLLPDETCWLLAVLERCPHVDDAAGAADALAEQVTLRRSPEEPVVVEPADNSRVFLSADDGQRGRELYVVQARVRWQGATRQGNFVMETLMGERR